jgi:hypothetical protein
LEKETLDPEVVAVSLVSSSGLSPRAEDDLWYIESEELNEDSKSITESLFARTRLIDLGILFGFPSEDWKAITWILPTLLASSLKQEKMRPIKPESKS